MNAHKEMPKNDIRHIHWPKNACNSCFSVRCFAFKLLSTLVNVEEKRSLFIAHYSNCILENAFLFQRPMDKRHSFINNDKPE